MADGRAQRVTASALTWYYLLIDPHSPKSYNTQNSRRSSNLATCAAAGGLNFQGEYMPNDRPLTTGQAAEYCHVSQATVINWIKNGTLHAYTTPGGHHRIPQSDLVTFLEAHDMPIAPALKERNAPRLLLVSDRPQMKSLGQALAESNELEVSVVGSDYEASAEAVRFAPDVVIIDGATSSDPAGLGRWIQESFGDASLLVYDSPDGEKGGTVTMTPEDLASLEARLKALLESAGTRPGSRLEGRGYGSETSRSRVQGRAAGAVGSRDRVETERGSGERPRGGRTRAARGRGER